MCIVCVCVKEEGGEGCGCGHHLDASFCVHGVHVYICKQMLVGHVCVCVCVCARA